MNIIRNVLNNNIFKLKNKLVHIKKIGRRKIRNLSKSNIFMYKDHLCFIDHL